MAAFLARVSGVTAMASSADAAAVEEGAVGGVTLREGCDDGLLRRWTTRPLWRLENERQRFCDVIKRENNLPCAILVAMIAFL